MHRGCCCSRHTASKCKMEIWSWINPHHYLSVKLITLLSPRPQQWRNIVRRISESFGRLRLLSTRWYTRIFTVKSLKWMDWLLVVQTIFDDTHDRWWSAYTLANQDLPIDQLLIANQPISRTYTLWPSHQRKSSHRLGGQVSRSMPPRSPIFHSRNHSMEHTGLAVIM